MKLGISEFNNDRYAIGDVELHCGDCFQLQLQNKKWLSVRLEYGEDWYLIDAKNNKYDMPITSVLARFYSPRELDRTK